MKISEIKKIVADTEEERKQKEYFIKNYMKILEVIKKEETKTKAIEKETFNLDYELFTLKEIKIESDGISFKCYVITEKKTKLKLYYIFNKKNFSFMNRYSQITSNTLKDNKTFYDYKTMTELINRLDKDNFILEKINNDYLFNNIHKTNIK